jgi:glycosyltransferase involved in cell wall biosynthesis
MAISVLHLRSSAGLFGAERVILNLLERLPPQGVRASLAVIDNYVTGNRELIEAASASGFPVSTLPCRSRWDPRTLFSLLRLAREEQVDLIHSHDYKSYFYGLIVAMLLRRPIVATLHGWILATRALRSYQKIEWLLLRRFDAIVTVSPSMNDEIDRHGLSRKLVTIINGIDTDRFAPQHPGTGRSHWGIANSDFVFGVIARLSIEKGHRVLLEAFARVARDDTRARLLIVGDGPDRQHLVDLTHRLGVDSRVLFTGTQTRIERLLHDVDCYVSPSLTEGMPMVVLEAMASGLPIVATDVGSLRQLLVPDAGVLVPPDDAEALARAMAGMLCDKYDVPRMRREARRRAVQLYGVDRQVEAYRDLYRRVVES